MPSRFNELISSTFSLSTHLPILIRPAPELILSCIACGSDSKISEINLDEVSGLVIRLVSAQILYKVMFTANFLRFLSSISPRWAGIGMSFVCWTTAISLYFSPSIICIFTNLAERNAKATITIARVRFNLFFGVLNRDMQCLLQINPP